MAYSDRSPSYEDLRGFSLVYLRAIALAWSDTDQGRQFIEALKSDTMQALQRYFNYQSPFTVDLEIQPTRQGKWIPAQMVNGKPVPGHWVDLVPNELVFNVPTKPAPMYEEAIAAAEYIDSGPNYLFSCC